MSKLADSLAEIYAKDEAAQRLDRAQSQHRQSDAQHASWLKMDELKAQQRMALSPEQRKANFEDALVKIPQERVALFMYYLKNGREREAVATANTPEETKRFAIAASMYNAERAAQSKEAVATTGASAKRDTGAMHSQAMVLAKMANPAFDMLPPDQQKASLGQMMSHLSGPMGLAQGMGSGAPQGIGGGLSINQPPPAPQVTTPGRPEMPPVNMGDQAGMAQTAVAPFQGPTPSGNPQFSPDFEANLQRGPGNAFSGGMAAGPPAPPGPPVLGGRVPEGYSPMDQLQTYLHIMELVRNAKEAGAPPPPDTGMAPPQWGNQPPPPPPPAAAPLPAQSYMGPQAMGAGEQSPPPASALTTLIQQILQHLGRNPAASDASGAALVRG
jgi:hypothetical protein